VNLKEVSSWQPDNRPHRSQLMEDGQCAPQKTVYESLTDSAPHRRQFTKA
jgi:hypothetical protein